MPALDSAFSTTHTLLARNGSLANNSTTQSNSTGPGLEVICAWPVSGQYGPGSRVLYYVVVAACIFARKAEWLRNACLAAALLFPMVAAIHGIVLAAEHNPHAVDMDVYGAFQLCALGALLAPLTVRTSRTYGSDPGRNAIFVWAMLVLAGLISLTVEFYRIGTHICTNDEAGNPISSDPRRFPYGETTCGMTCSEEDGPRSPLRGGANSNIYVIPAPDHFTFNAATLVSAGCCIPAILLLASTWMKILELNWRKMFAHEDSIGEVKNNKVIKAIRRYAIVVIFGGAVLAILIIGEWNLFSPQVDYQTEPLSNVGQWAPIVGTGLAVLGSVYILLAEAMNNERANPGGESGIIHETAKLLIRISDHIFNPAKERFDTSHFRRGSAMAYPEIPGETLRNRALTRTTSLYSRRRSSNGSSTSALSAISRQRSGTMGSAVSDTPIDRVSTEVKTHRRRDTLEVPNSIHRTSSAGTPPTGPTATDDPIIRVESPDIAQLEAVRTSPPNMRPDPFIARLESHDAPGIMISPESRRQSTLAADPEKT